MKVTPRAIVAGGLAFVLVCNGAQVIAQTAAPSPGGKSLASSVGVLAYPEKKQTAALQAQDESECYSWARTQSGYDPMRPPAPVTPATPTATADGSRAVGALRGAAAGAVIGEIASNDGGKGAAIGAITGVLAGGRRNRIAQSQQAQQANAQAAASAAQLQAAFKQGMGICLQARGYAVK